MQACCTLALGRFQSHLLSGRLHYQIEKQQIIGTDNDVNFLLFFFLFFFLASICLLCSFDSLSCCSISCSDFFSFFSIFSLFAFSTLPCITESSNSPHSFLVPVDNDNVGTAVSRPSSRAASRRRSLPREEKQTTELGKDGDKESTHEQNDSRHA